MKELIVISGKGGTGKTSVTASLCVLAENAAIADCDVDAADLHLVLSPEVNERTNFYSGHEAIIREADCGGCGECAAKCRFNAIHPVEKDGQTRYVIDPMACEGCGVCVITCPQKAIDYPDRLCGEWMKSQTRRGPMVHAKMVPAAENSGRLVATVRQEAKNLAEQKGRDLVIVDGPPGIGCPVISSLSGATLALIVTEPTVSGEHDFERVQQLANHFKVPTLVCVNKWDINPEMTGRIETKARQQGASVAGRIRYDRSVSDAQTQGKAVVECGTEGCSKDIHEIWDCVKNKLSAPANATGSTPSPRKEES